MILPQSNEEFSIEQSKKGSSIPARKSHSKETARIPVVVERAQALISDNPGQLRKLASIVGVSEPTMSNCRGGPSTNCTY